VFTASLSEPTPTVVSNLPTLLEMTLTYFFRRLMTTMTPIVTPTMTMTTLLLIQTTLPATMMQLPPNLVMTLAPSQMKTTMTPQLFPILQATNLARSQEWMAQLPLLRPMPLMTFQE
jgi:hypothetical protein